MQSFFYIDFYFYFFLLFLLLSYFFYFVAICCCLCSRFDGVVFIEWTSIPSQSRPIYIYATTVFDSAQGSAVELVFAISQQQIDVLGEVFPEYDKKRVVISPNGINQTIFHKLTDMNLTQVLETLETAPYEGSKEKPQVVDTVKAPKFDKMVLFVGKFADWKRLDALLKAAAEYEQDPSMAKVATVIVGSGPLDAQKLYQGLAKDLNLQRVFFVGPRPQPVLAQLYSVASVCVFPSKVRTCVRVCEVRSWYYFVSIGMDTRQCIEMVWVSIFFKLIKIDFMDVQLIM
jgi:glycosyltransferase involved in cell wall biosynthesis